MNEVAPGCPCCGSRSTAARRELFHSLMNGIQPKGAFNWYNESDPQVLPPKSLLVMFFLLMMALAIPAGGFWLLGHYPAANMLVSVALLSLFGLLFDVLLTYRRYKAWSAQWICDQCHGVFTPLSV